MSEDNTEYWTWYRAVIRFGIEDIHRTRRIESEWVQQRRHAEEMLEYFEPYDDDWGAREGFIETRERIPDEDA